MALPESWHIRSRARACAATERPFEDGEPIVPNGRITLAELNEKTPADLVAFAEQLEIENASNLRRQDLLFAILKTLADDGVIPVAKAAEAIKKYGIAAERSNPVNV
jgi:transcription termination factor Rho